MKDAMRGTKLLLLWVLALQFTVKSTVCLAKSTYIEFNAKTITYIFLEWRTSSNDKYCM